jgi:hypothetical protein
VALNQINLTLEDHTNLRLIREFLKNQNYARYYNNSGLISFALKLTVSLMEYDKDKPIEEQLMNK